MVSVRTFSVMYDYTLSYDSNSSGLTSGHTKMGRHFS